MALEPGGIIAWIIVGLVAGWMTGKVMKRAGYGAFGDITLGIIVGAFIGGIVMNRLRYPGPGGLRRQHRDRVHRRGHLGGGRSGCRRLRASRPPI